MLAVFLHVVVRYFSFVAVLVVIPRLIRDWIATELAKLAEERPALLHMTAGL